MSFNGENSHSSEGGKHAAEGGELSEFSRRLKANFGERAMRAIDALEISQLSAPGYKDPNAPKRDRDRLREDI